MPKAQDYYASYGIAADFDQVVHTGVLVLSPSHHRYLLARLYPFLLFESLRVHSPQLAALK